MQWDARELTAIDGDIDGIGAGSADGELLEIEDEIAGGEEDVLGQQDLEGGLHGRDDGAAILIDEEDIDGVETLLFLAEEDAQRDGALRMDGGEGAGDDGIERAEQAELSVVIDRGIAERSDLDFHAGEGEGRDGDLQCRGAGAFGTARDGVRERDAQ